VRGLIVACVVLAAAPVRADDARDAEARRLYEEGKDAFVRHEWNLSYLRFRDAYMISQLPALLFNMASALKEDGRPGESAENLRSYLRVVPGTPDRAEIEQRILTLEEAQRILDREHKHSADEEAARRAAERPPVIVAPPPPPRVDLTPPPIAAPRSSPPISIEREAAARARRKKIGLAIGLSIGGALVIVGVVAIAVAVSGPDVPSPTPSTLGVWKGTP